MVDSNQIMMSPVHGDTTRLHNNYNSSQHIEHSESAEVEVPVPQSQLSVHAAVPNGATALPQSSISSHNGDAMQDTVVTVQTNGQPTFIGQYDSESEVDLPKAKNLDKVWLRVKLLCLALVIVIVWGLLSLPIVFFHLPVEYREATNVTNTTNGGLEGLTCSSIVPYDGSVCLEELELLRNCLPDSNQTNRLLVGSDQSEKANKLLSGLELFASEECKAAARPFLCVHFFGLCDSTGRAYRPSSSQCTEISTGVCSQEWALAGSLPGVTLPDCASFPDETILIPGSCENTNELSSGDTPTDLIPSPSDQEVFSQTQTCTCRDDFYCKNGTNLCLPECGSWKQYPPTTSTIVDVMLLVAGTIGALSAIAVFIVAGVKRRKLLVFPSVFLVYQSAVLLVMIIFIFITFIDRVDLYCSSQDLVESLMSPTPFCAIAGIVFYYGLLQLGVWWVFHIAALFWKLQFPFHARRMEATHRTRYIHLVAAILGFLIPVVPVVATAIEHAVRKSKDPTNTAGGIGFTMTRFPPILCTGSVKEVTYYSLILPLNLILLVGMTLLVLVFWTIHKHHGLFKEKKSKSPFKIGTAERKILIVFCYYVFVSVISLVALTLATRVDELVIREISEYFVCELSHPSEPCPRPFEGRLYPFLTGTSFVLLGLFTFVVLIFVTNFRELKEKLVHCLRRLPGGVLPPSTPVVSTSSNSDPTSTGTTTTFIKSQK